MLYGNLPSFDTKSWLVCLWGLGLLPGPFDPVRWGSLSPKLRSSWLSWWSEKAVRALRGFLGGMADCLSN